MMNAVIVRGGGFLLACLDMDWIPCDHGIMKNPAHVPITVLAVLFIAAAFSIFGYGAVMALTGLPQPVFYNATLVIVILFLASLVYEAYVMMVMPQKKHSASRHVPAKRRSSHRRK